MPLAPFARKDAPNKELKEAWGYYHTPRCQYPTAPGFVTARSLNQIITYDAFNMAEVFLTQPLQIVAGSMVGSEWMNDDPYKRAASTKKDFHVVEGANHMSLTMCLSGTWLAHPVDELHSEHVDFAGGHMLERSRLFLISALGETVLTTGTAIVAVLMTGDDRHHRRRWRVPSRSQAWYLRTVPRVSSRVQVVGTVALLVLDSCTRRTRVRRVNRGGCEPGILGDVRIAGEREITFGRAAESSRERGTQRTSEVLR